MAPDAKPEYPRTWGQFLDQFATEEACAAYLERLRWPPQNFATMRSPKPRACEERGAARKTWVLKPPAAYPELRQRRTKLPRAATQRH
jgi:hypothetical protein